MTYREGTTNRTITKLIQKKIGCYPDGIWGKLTTEAVKAWQRDHGLTADGIAGPRTLAAMGISAVTPSASTSLVASITSCYAGRTITLKRSRRKIDYIAVHCTATPEGQDLTVAQIKAEHLKRGFSDVGYHYIIYRDGTVNLGRDVNIAGAHVTDYNSHSIGIAYVGGLENRLGVPYNKLKAKDTRTQEQKASLLVLLTDLRKLYPKAVIQGHRDFSPDKNHNGVVEPSEWIKSCPCFEAKTEYRKI